MSSFRRALHLIYERRLLKQTKVQKNSTGTKVKVRNRGVAGSGGSTGAGLVDVPVWNTPAFWSGTLGFGAYCGVVGVFPCRA